MSKIGNSNIGIFNITISNTGNPNINKSKDTDLHEASARLETLELKIMELENTVSELNEVILTQYRDHQTLTAIVEQLNARLSQMTDASAGDDSLPSAADEVPPHY